MNEESKPLHYYTIRNYGTNHRYLNDPAIRRAVSILTGQKTISGDQLVAMELLGYTPVEILPPKIGNSPY